MKLAGYAGSLSAPLAGHTYSGWEGQMDRLIDPEEVGRFENATWSRCAKGYVNGFGALVREAIRPLLDKVNVNRGDRVLDVGTGPGLVAAAAEEQGADVVGVDFSEAMLAEARRLHPAIEFRAASADALPFADSTFDAVVGNFILHHAGRFAKVLEESFRVLRRGGRVGFTVWADLSKLEAIGLFFAAVAEHAGAAELPHGPLFVSATSTCSTRCSVRPGFVTRRSENSQRSGGCGRSIPSWRRFETGRSWMRFRTTFETELKQRCERGPARTDPATALQCRIRPFSCRQ
jgi:SAM-dependent methyltransferase